MFENLAPEQRIELAKAKMEKVLDHFLYVLELHANNKFVVFSPTLSKQIPVSFAANAFNVFQRSMHQMEIVRLCALWDSADRDKENIPTVVNLVDNDTIIEMLAEETRDHRVRQQINTLNESPDQVEVASASIEFHFAHQQASNAKVELKKAIAAARIVLASSRLASIMNLRDKHLAHSLIETRREKRAPVQPMASGDGKALLDESIPIIEALFCWVNGKSFSIENSQKIDHDNAQALWAGCKFTVIR